MAASVENQRALAQPLGEASGTEVDMGASGAAHLHWQTMLVDQHARAAIKQQKPRCVWFTGLSGAGKSTLASQLDKRLHAQGLHTYVLDGDNVRHGLNKDLGFSDADRVENIRRVAEVARLMVDAGLVVIVAFISPFHADRAFARSLFVPGEFVEVFVDTPLSECERRDSKGLYASARAGQLANFTGVSSPYERPLDPEIRLDCAVQDIGTMLDAICKSLVPAGWITRLKLALAPLFLFLTTDWASCLLSKGYD